MVGLRWSHWNGLAGLCCIGLERIRWTGLLWLVSVGLNETRVCIELVESGTSRLITFALGAHSMRVVVGSIGKHWIGLDRFEYIAWISSDGLTLIASIRFGLGWVRLLDCIGLDWSASVSFH